MWYRWLVGIAFIIFVSLIWMAGQEHTQKLKVINAPLKTANGVHMVEENMDNGSVLRVTATKLIQMPDNMLGLYDLALYTEKGIQIKCDYAKYDIKSSILEVPGNLSLKTTKNVTKVFIRGLSWDRKTGRAETENPIRVETKGGIIKAKKAEFSDNFQRTTFLGGVYAKVSTRYIPL